VPIIQRRDDNLAQEKFRSQRQHNGGRERTTTGQKLSVPTLALKGCLIWPVAIISHCCAAGEQ
jgi:hypothetical protein